MSCLSFWEAFSFGKTNLDSSFIYVLTPVKGLKIENGLTFMGSYSILQLLKTALYTSPKLPSPSSLINVISSRSSSLSVVSVISIYWPWFPLVASPLHKCKYILTLRIAFFCHFFVDDQVYLLEILVCNLLFWKWKRIRKSFAGNYTYIHGRKCDF